MTTISSHWDVSLTPSARTGKSIDLINTISSSSRMRRLNLDQLQSFLVVAETGSFSEAGRRLNLTQSAVSQQIKELEARLGTRILDRLGKKAHPTPAGEDLLEHARRLIQQSDLVVEAMRTHRDGGWGRVRLATSATLAAYVLPPVLLGAEEALSAPRGGRHCRIGRQGAAAGGRQPGRPRLRQHAGPSDRSGAGRAHRQRSHR